MPKGDRGRTKEQVVGARKKKSVRSHIMQPQDSRFDELYGTEDISTLPDAVVHCPYCEEPMIAATAHRELASVLNYGHRHYVAYTWTCMRCNKATRVFGGTPFCPD